MSARTTYIVGAVLGVAVLGGTVLAINWNASKQTSNTIAETADTETGDGITVAEAVSAIDATGTVEAEGLDAVDAAEPTSDFPVAVIVPHDAPAADADAAIVTETAETVDASVVPAETQPE